MHIGPIQTISGQIVGFLKE